ncbi:VOC family protein [Paenibacillus pasadenensis]|uniref:PhnB protein n=1 Tax=Paenibacillus pasadenensis TaxID=217090 RepID=A0A2N5N1R7_9BACL|nr:MULTISPECIES: VOC family protein [Paenibacillus]PLT44281.1 PhnB protein [Paenibacillus pasadenensis]QGG54802.1 VOC family protein [Paenibacillus sp. B01]
MAKLTPYLMSVNARQQAEFYIEALGGEILNVMTHDQMPGAGPDASDKVLHMTIVAGGVTFFLCDGILTPQPGSHTFLSLEFTDDADARSAFDRLSQDGQIYHPLEQAFWGTLFGQLTDRFGVNWMITTEQQTR